MRPGLRLQILLLLGGLLLVTFLPLYFAVATYTRYTLQEVRTDSARALGRAIAGQVSEARVNRPARDIADLLGAQVGESGVEAIGLYDENGVAVSRVGAPDTVNKLSERIDPKREAVSAMTTPHGRAIAVVVPDAHGAVVAVLRTDAEAAHSASLVPLLGLYMALIALALLLSSYFALTRFIVRPLDALSRAAQRVAGGARQLDVPTEGGRELLELGSSVQTMTKRLLREEEALRKKVDEVERATEQLKEAQEGLVRSERLASVGRLAAGLAHEVGNPIAALIGMQDLLLQGGMTEAEQRDFLQRMRKETERINSILRDLLQFARPAAASVEPGDVEVAIHDTVTLVLPQKAMHDVDIEVDVFPELPRVPMSREQLVQVLLNLLLNAADACSSGGHVSVRAAPSERGVRLSVEDDGPGVPDNIRSRLFEPFATTKDVGKGTGLGLAVCRGLVESVGGSIILDASARQGARFVVDLPRASA